MTHSRKPQLLFVSAALLLSACSTDSGPNDPGASADGTIVHMVRMHNSSDGTEASAVTPAITGLTFFGGPTLKNPDVHPVFWNLATNLQANLNALYCALVSCPPIAALLAQYGIGAGTCHPGFVDNRTATSVSDAAIHTELNRLFTAGSLPSPNANTYYPVHFPSGVVITAPDGSRSCVQFCGYHGTYVRNGVNVNYGVIPDIGSGGCQSGCGTGTVTDNTDSVASHEYVEAVTDPAVGLATVFGPPLAWYDQVDNGEIGDLCNGQEAIGCCNGFTVQKEWSNAAHACVCQ